MAGEAFRTLQHHYSDRLAAAREAHLHGSGVVGLVGSTVPRELVLAVNRFPVLVAAQPGQPTPTADIYMEPVIPPETRSLFEAAVDGQFEFFDLLVLSRPYAQLYYYLKEVYRLGRAPRLPPLHMHDLMPSRRQAVRAYNWSQSQSLVTRLERLAGEEISESRLRGAIDLTNRVRALQRKLLACRWQGMLSGTDALQAIGAGYFMAPAIYADALSTYLSQLAADPSLAGRPRLLVLPSEPLSDLHLHEVLEAAGALVVAEDDWWGARAPGGDVPLAGSAHEAILQKYWLNSATSAVHPAEAREGWFEAHATRPDVDGVVFYLPPSDHQLGWDYPRLKGCLDARAGPSILLRHDAATPDGRAVIQAQAADWLRNAPLP